MKLTAEATVLNDDKLNTDIAEATQIAGNTAQYFWHTETGTDTGAHITEITKEEFLADPSNGGGNLLARSNGIAIRDGLDELASFDATTLKVGASWDNGFTFSAGVVSGVGTYGKISLGTAGSSTAPYIMLRDDNVVNLTAGGNTNYASYINLKPNTSGNGDIGDVYIGAGTLETSGYLKVQGHSSAIGTVFAGTVRDSLALTSGTAKYLARLVDLPAGKWVAIGSVRFPANTAGGRRLNISTTQDSTAITVQMPSGTNNAMQLQVVEFLQPNSATTYYLNAYQNSGSSLTASDVTFRAIRIA